MPDPPVRVLAFDIGIRNLAWCFLEAGNGLATIRGWQNYDLLLGAGAEVPKAKQLCASCSVGAAWQVPGRPATCLRHCPPTHPPLKDLSGGAPFKKLPGLPVLRTLAASGPIPLPKKATKAKLLELLGSRHSLPLEKVKLKKAVEHELATIHDAIRSFVLANAELFRQATHILLENQPVLKNPTMKSVQILLFATLRDVLQPGPPPLKLVHASKKVKGAATTTGDAGYKGRKDASEARVEEVLGRAVPVVSDAGGWLTRFKAHAKRSDLADAFCMCADYAALA
jgi:hypothetical protein